MQLSSNLPRQNPRGETRHRHIDVLENMCNLIPLTRLRHKICRGALEVRVAFLALRNLNSDRLHLVVVVRVLAPQRERRRRAASPLRGRGVRGLVRRLRERLVGRQPDADDDHVEYDGDDGRNLGGGRGQDIVEEENICARAHHVQDDVHARRLGDEGHEGRGDGYRVDGA